MHNCTMLTAILGHVIHELNEVEPGLNDQVRRIKDIKNPRATYVEIAPKVEVDTVGGRPYARPP